MRRTLFALLPLLWLAPVVLAQPKTEPAPAPVDTGKLRVYQKVVGSTVWIHSNRGDGRLATGSGSLVDKGRRLVLTNYHVVGDVKKATVFFPVFEARSRSPSGSTTSTAPASSASPARWSSVDKQADLALIRVDRVPEACRNCRWRGEPRPRARRSTPSATPARAGRCGSTRRARSGRSTPRSGRRSSTSGRLARSRRRWSRPIRRPTPATAAGRSSTTRASWSASRRAARSTPRR